MLSRLASVVVATSLLALGACATTEPNVDLIGPGDGSGSGSGEITEEPTAACKISIYYDSGGFYDLEYDDAAHLTAWAYGGNPPLLYHWSTVSVKADAGDVDTDVVEYPTAFVFPDQSFVRVNSRVQYHPMRRELPASRVFTSVNGEVVETVAYSYNTNFRLVSAETKNKTGAVTRRQRYYYNAAEQLTSQFEDLFATGATTPTFTHQTKLIRDAAGKIIKTEVLNGTTLLYSTAFEYDSGGLPTRTVQTGSNGDVMNFSFEGEHAPCAKAVDRWRRGYFDPDEP